MVSIKTFKKHCQQFRAAIASSSNSEWKIAAPPERFVIAKVADRIVRTENELVSDLEHFKACQRLEKSDLRKTHRALMRRYAQHTLWMPTRWGWFQARVRTIANSPYKGRYVLRLRLHLDALLDDRHLLFEFWRGDKSECLLDTLQERLSGLIEGVFSGRGAIAVDRGQTYLTAAELHILTDQSYEIDTLEMTEALAVIFGGGRFDYAVESAVNRAKRIYRARETQTSD